MCKVTPTTITHRLESEENHEEYLYQNFKKKKIQEDDNDRKIKKNENMPLVRKVKV